jgi:hypothetical protein
LSNLPAGTNVAIAVATDNNLLTAQSPPVSFSLHNAPTVSLKLSPTSTNLPLGASYSLQAAVTTNGTIVTNVEFMVNGAVIGQAGAAPFSQTFTTNQAGLYALLAVGMDDLGQSGTSAPVTVRFHFPEKVPPRITITNAPRNFTRVLNLTNYQVRVAGTASDDHGVDHIEYQVTSGPFLQSQGAMWNAQGTTNWQAWVTLAPGNNSVRFQSVDFNTNKSAPITRYWTYVVPAQLNLQIKGSGTVTPDLTDHLLENGQVYTATARATQGWIFSGWTGDVVSANAALSFEMRSNLNLTANFATNPFPHVAGTYVGVFTNLTTGESSEAGLESSGLITLQLGGLGAFTGKLSMNGANYPFHGTFSADGTAMLPILRGHLAPSVLVPSLDFSGQVPGMTGTVFSAMGPTLLSSDLFADRNLYNSRTNAAPQAGVRHFVLLEDTGSGSITNATGQTKVGTGGLVQFSGALTDKRNFSMASVLYPDLDHLCPFYVSLGQGSEALLGYFRFGTTNEPLRGQLFWLRPGTNGVHFLQVKDAGF